MQQIAKVFSGVNQKFLNENAFNRYFTLNECECLIFNFFFQFRKVMFEVMSIDKRRTEINFKCAPRSKGLEKNS